MSAETPINSAPNALLASQQQQTAGEYIRTYLRKLRSGDLGTLPILFGLVIIAIIFQAANPNFLTPRNMVQLIIQMAGTATIAYGIVFVLLLGEIDLSVSYVSAVAGVSMALLIRSPDNVRPFLFIPLGLFIAFVLFSAAKWTLRRQGTRVPDLPLALVAGLIGLGIGYLIVFSLPASNTSLVAIPLALIAAAVIGAVQGTIITTFQLPSFVVTLAGFLGWSGVVLLLIGGAGTVNIQDPLILGISRSFLPSTVGWIAGALFILVYGYTKFQAAQTRRSQGLASQPTAIVIGEIVALALVVIAVLLISGLDRGVPLVGVLLLIMLAILTFVAERTRFGRYVYAVGGSKEAARRAGLNVERIRVQVFILASFMAGVGGIIFASRLGSVATNAGGGDLLLNSIAAAVIGGTSLFGGRGRVSSALLGALVIAAIENGMGLLGLSAGVKSIITGIVLLIAVIIDALSRRTQTKSGMA